MRPTEPTPTILLCHHRLSGADGGEHDLEDALAVFLLDDGAGDVRAVEHDDQVHEEEEQANADFGGFAVHMRGTVHVDDLDRLEHGIGFGGDDAAVGELFAQEDGGNGRGEGVLEESDWPVLERGVKW